PGAQPPRRRRGEAACGERGRDRGAGARSRAAARAVWRHHGAAARRGHARVPEGPDRPAADPPFRARYAWRLARRAHTAARSGGGVIWLFAAFLVVWGNVQ